MLKLSKGLKKKKKGKKSKKDKELFNEEELEQYRREHQQNPEEDVTGNQSEHPEHDDEWSKFNALTAGVDSILKKTQGDLNRIKSTSFFQRVPTPSETKKVKERKEETAANSETVEEEAERKEREILNTLADAVVELSESESETDEVDDIFDTTYISGEIGLVNVEEEDLAEGPDPFDTSYADKVIKGPEVSKRGKKLVSIGSAVQVLTGKVETASTIISRRPRRGPKDLLLEASLDTEQQIECESSSEPAKTLLDDPDDDIPNIPIDLSISLHLSLQKDKIIKKQEEKEDLDFNLDILKEFDSKNLVNQDEFAELAAEALNKKDENSFIGIRNSEIFEDWNKTKVPPPRPVSGPNFLNEVDGEDLSFEEDTVDPFDTAFVEKLLPATFLEDSDFDPRAVDSEQLDNEKDFFSPHSEDNFKELKLETIDLFEGSNTDISQIDHPIAPVYVTKESKRNAVDPFDTSAVQFSPGTTELKFLEKELLSDQNTLKNSLSDPDFDPRAEEEILNSSSVTITESAAQRKSSLILNIATSNPRLVSFAVATPDLLKLENSGGKIQKPLTPYYTKNIAESEQAEKDPFDTTFVAEIKPTIIELNLLERDLLSSPNLKHSISDPDFDPRAESPKLPINNLKPDLLSAFDDYNCKALTPAVEEKEAIYQPELYKDPFDTSSIANNIQPGQAELKVLASEFVPKSESNSEDLFADSQESVFAAKVLTPQIPIKTESFDDIENDPFDTSFAINLGPGQAEIRLLETELIHKQ